MIIISSNTVVLSENNNIDGLIRNLLEAELNGIIFLDGGSSDGSYEKLKE